MVRAYLCVDIGGTKTAFALFGQNGEEFYCRAFPTRPEEGAEALIGRIRASLEEKLPEFDLAGGVIAAPGPLDAVNGLLLHPVMLGWVNTPVAEMFSQAFGIGFSLMNDCDAGALGVAQEFGFAERGTLCYISLSTGVGGGTVVDGRILNGAGNASDFGHIPVPGEGLICACGKKDCLELYSSGSGIEKRFAAKTGRSLPCAEIASLAREGDRAAKTVFAAAAVHLAYAVQVIRATIDPETVVFGGSVCNDGDLLFPALENAGVKTVCTAQKGKQVLHGAFLRAKTAELHI